MNKKYQLGNPKMGDFSTSCEYAEKIRKQQETPTKCGKLGMFCISVHKSAADVTYFSYPDVYKRQHCV